MSLNRIEEQKRPSGDEWLEPLTEAEDIVRALRAGEVDALVVRAGDEDRIYTLKGADYGYRVLFETLNEGALTLSGKGVILYANNRFAELVGLPLEQVIGSSFREYVVPADEPRFLAKLGEGMVGSSKGEVSLVRSDGALVTAGISLNVVAVEGTDSACTAVVTDLTELRRAQKALEIANAELEVRVEERTLALQQANEALKEADRRKDEFLSTLAHELRNPLAPILNAVTALDIVGGQEPRDQRLRGVIERQVKNLARLVDDLLDVSRITRGAITLRNEPLNAANIVGDAVNAVRPIVDAMGHQLDVALPDEPVWLVGDPTRLEQVLVNLLNNAVKYTEPSGRIAIFVEREGDEVLFRVCDTGIGIAAELLPTVFDLFVQAQHSLDRAQGGLGIGLTLAKRLVEMHGGEIRASSAGINHGSEFVVRLPIHPGQGRPETIIGSGVAQPTRSSIPVLIVEDNTDAAESLAELLQLWGHTVQVVNRGEAALELLPRFRPRVVLCDLGLPGMDGYAVARRLREHLSLSDTLLIAVSGYGQEEDLQRAEAAGFSLHLTKPVDPHMLEDLLALLAESSPTGAR